MTYAKLATSALALIAVSASAANPPSNVSYTHQPTTPRSAPMHHTRRVRPFRDFESLELGVRIRV